MAISITQKPTTPNAAYTYLPYVVSGSVTTGNPQYSYVMDIYESGSSTRLNRITQVPNPSGVAVFDPSRLLQTKLSYDNNWKTLGSTDKVNAVKTFEIKFGEQYSTSISSSVTVYSDLATHELEVFPAVIDPNNGSSYNFNTSSFAETGNRFLSNFPGVKRGLNNTVPQPNGYPYICDSSDYMTLTSFNEDYQTSNMITVSGYFLSSSRNWVNPVGNALWSVNLTGASDGYFTTYGIGPKNISEFNSIASASIASGATNMLYTSNVNGGAVIAIENNWNGGFMVTGSAIGNTYNVWDFSKVQLPQNNEYIRFAFINDYGFYDYYNVYSPIQRRTKVDRKNVSLPKINYSGTAVPYSSKDGGETSFYTDLNDSYTVTTQWLDQEMANYLEELLDSPEVFVQQDDEFVPVVINNQSYISNQSTARNKLFQYTIELSPANGRDLESRITTCNPQPEPPPPPPIVLDYRYPEGMVTSGLVHFYNAWDNINDSSTWYDTVTYGQLGSVSGSINAGTRYTGTTLEQMVSASYYSDFVGGEDPTTVAPVIFNRPWDIVQNANSGSAYTVQTFSRQLGPTYLWTGIWTLGEKTTGNSLNLGVYRTGTAPTPDKTYLYHTSKFATNTQVTKYYPNAVVNPPNPLTADFNMTTMRVGSASIAPDNSNLWVSVDTGSFYQNSDFNPNAVTIPADGDNWLGKSFWDQEGFPRGEKTWRSPNAFMYHAIYDRTLTDAEVNQNYNAFVSSSFPIAT